MDRAKAREKKVTLMGPLLVWERDCSGGGRDGKR